MQFVLRASIKAPKIDWRPRFNKLDQSKYVETSKYANMADVSDTLKLALALWGPHSHYLLRCITFLLLKSDILNCPSQETVARLTRDLTCLL